MDLKKKLILEIKSDKKQRGSVLEQYRPELIEMKRRYFSQREMAEKMNKVGIKISRQAITNYFRKRPITMEELNGKNESGSVNLNQWKKQKTVKKTKSKKPVFFDISKPFK
jgi:hypothetical protein